MSGLRLLRKWSDAPGAGQQSVGEALDDAFPRHRNRLALADRDGRYTYAELDDLSGRIARLLLRRSARRTGNVALLLDQGRTAIAATIGALRAGCCFVPLDINDPEARLQWIVNDCKPSFILTDERHRKAAGRLAGVLAQVVDVGDAAVESSASIAAPVVPGGSTAYIIYTSGSTGQPKGVCQSHRNLLHFVHSYGKTLGINREERLSMLYSLSFSASHMDVFSGLLNGASVHLFDVKKRGAMGLREWLDDERISVLHTVPTLFRYLMKGAPDGFVYEHIRAVDLGGEPVYASDVEMARLHLPPSCGCFNHFAATEASVISQYRIRLDGDYESGRIPVGRPSEGIEVRIMREDGSPADGNEVGEIVVLSPYVSTGYWNRPEFNEAKFFDDETGVRGYRTGDLGSMDEAGNMQYLGRSGSRVKVRGHSVDLAEIESVLNGSEEIRNAVVVPSAEEAHPDGARLIAYVAFMPQSGGSAADLSKLLAARLPGYMIPARIVIKETLPLTPTGKIDRARLRDTDPGVHEPGQDFVAPATETEQTLAALVAEVLNVDEVGAEDSFFELGGESLLTAQFLEAVEERFGVDIPLAEFSARPAVRAVASMLDERCGDSERSEDPGRADFQPGATTTADGSPLVPMQTGGTHTPFFFVPGGRGDDDVVGSTYSGLAKHLGEDQPFYGLVEHSGDEADEYPEVEWLAARFIDAIRTVQPEGPYYLGGGCIGGIVAYEMAQQLREQGEAVRTLILINTEVPTDEVRHNVDRKRGGRRKGRRIRRRAIFIFSRLRFHLQQLQALKPRQRLEYLGARAARGAAMSSEISRYNERIDARLRKLMWAYRPRPCDGDVNLIMARRLKWSSRINWGDFVRGRLRVYDLTSRPGGAAAPGPMMVGQQVRACLDEARKL